MKHTPKTIPVAYIEIPKGSRNKYEYDEYDRESEAADYAEYMREVEMEAYEGRRGR